MKTKKTAKIMLALFMALLTVIGIIPLSSVTAFAASGPTPSRPVVSISNGRNTIGNNGRVDGLYVYCNNVSGATKFEVAYKQLKSQITREECDVGYNYCYFNTPNFVISADKLRSGYWYHVQVRAWNGSEWSPWSTKKTMTFLKAPTFNEAYTSDSLSQMLRISLSEGAHSYTVKQWRQRGKTSAILDESYRPFPQTNNSFFEYIRLNDIVLSERTYQVRAKMNVDGVTIYSNWQTKKCFSNCTLKKDQWEKMIYNRLINLHATKYQACGIVGNLSCDNGYHLTINGQVGVGVGIACWDVNKLKQYLPYYYESLWDQVDYMWNTYHPTYITKNDLGAATRDFYYRYVIRYSAEPNLDASIEKRIQRARALYMTTPQ